MERCSGLNDRKRYNVLNASRTVGVLGMRGFVQLSMD